MKRLLFLFAGLLLTLQAVGQDPVSAETYREQYVALSGKYTKNPTDVANLIDMAQFFTRADNPLHNLPQAARYARRAEEIYSAWLMDRGRYRDMQKLIKKGITLSLIRQQVQSIEDQAVRYVQHHAATMQETEIAAYAVAFADNAAIAKALHAAKQDNEYRQVCRENTINGYYTYLLAHPATPQADSAEAALARLASHFFASFNSLADIDSAAALYPSSAAMQNAAMRQKSRMAYFSASQTHDQEAYSAYMEHFPRGDNYLDALDKLQTLRSMDYGMLSSPRDFADFAETYSDHPLADSALTQLRRMVKHDHNREAALLYIERFPLDVHYSDVYREYYSWFADEGNGQPIRSFAHDNPGYPFLMTVRSDLARSEVIDTFDLTKPFVEADMPRMTDCIRLLTGRKAAFVAMQRVLQQQLARKDWNGALQRLHQFDICFEDVSSAEYNELLAILSSKGMADRSPLFAHGRIHHLFANPQGSRLFFTIQSDGNAIGTARKPSKGKGGWEYAGSVHIVGASSDVTAFGFYDNGSRVLLGIDDDIWSARVVNDTLWTDLVAFGTPVNTPFVETDAFMLPDGSGMLLASDRPGGHNVQESGAYYHGDTALASDLYFIPYADGHWGDAVNLGLPVNSPYCERSPLLSRNMRTLYFVTDARGLGYGDVYMVTRSDIGDWSHWTNPVNLGRGANGAFDEASVSFLKGEKQLLLTSNSPQGGNYAGFTLATTHDTADSRRTVTLNLAEVEDVLSELDIIDPRDRKTVQRLNDHQLDTLLPVTLYTGNPYVALFTADWLYIPALRIDGSTAATLSVDGYTIDELRQLTDPIPLALVGFYNGTSRLLPLAERELDNVVLFLRQHAGCKVTVSVHVDGNDDRRCYDLSLNRAKSIRNYIASQGIDIGRVDISAYGNLKYKQGLAPSPTEILFR